VPVPNGTACKNEPQWVWPMRVKMRAAGAPHMQLKTDGPGPAWCESQLNSMPLCSTNFLNCSVGFNPSMNDLSTLARCHWKKEAFHCSTEKGFSLYKPSNDEMSTA